MVARVYRFPEQKVKYKGYKIPLYTDEEVRITVLAMNSFSVLTEKVTEYTITEYEPLVVIKALVEAKSSGLFSPKTKQLIVKILKSIEPIEQNEHLLFT